MCESLFNASELRYLWRVRGNKNYDFKGFFTNGTFTNYILFEDLWNCQHVLGKIVTNPREGEAYHWPRLQHENLAPLLDTVSINEKISIYILPLIGRNLKIAMHDSEFLMNSENFNRKRAYAEDILLALDYLHSKSLCVMNLTELIFHVSAVSDKAILCDFHCVHLIGKAKKEDLDLPVLYKAPELKTDYFDPISAETWSCGVMFLQLFTNNMLPSGFVGEEVQRILQAVRELNCEVIKEANPGAQINPSIIEELKTFLNLFLVEDPNLRANVREAVASTFLRDLTRVKINDYCSSAFCSSNNDFGSLEMSKQINPNYRKRLTSPFKDIYLKEVENYRDKFKKIPCTNKFINLKSVRHSYDMTKYPGRNKYTKNEKSGHREKPTAKQTRSSELHPGHKLKDSTTYYKEITPVAPKSAENFESSEPFNAATNSDLEKIPNNFGDVTEKAVKNAEVYDGISAFHKIDDATKTSENYENSEVPNLLNHITNSDSAKTTNNFGDVAENVVQNKIHHSIIIPTSHEIGDGSDTNSKSPNTFSDAASSDLEEIPANFEDLTMNIVKNDNQLSIDLASHKTDDARDKNYESSNTLNDIASSDLEVPDSFAEEAENGTKNKDDHCSISAFQKANDAIKSSAIYGNLCETECSGKELLDLQSSSDSLISLDSLEDPRSNKKQTYDTHEELEFISHVSEKPDNCDLKVDAKIEQLGDATDKMSSGYEIDPLKSAFAQNPLCNSRQSGSDSHVNCFTDIKDNVNNPDFAMPSQSNYENSCQNNEIEKKDLDKTEAKCTKTQCVSQNHLSCDAVTPTDKVSDVRKDTQTQDEVHLQSDKNDDVKTVDNLHSSFAKCAEEDETVAVSLGNMQNERQTNSKQLSRTISYEKAISKGQRSQARSETVTPIKENKLTLGKRRSFLNIIPFMKKTSVTKVKSAEDIGVKSANDLPVLCNKDNFRDSPNVSSMEKCLLEEGTPVKIPRKVKKSKKNKWLKYFLCFPIKR